MSCGNENIILGLPWLKEANPNIDWEKESLTLDDKIDQSKELVELHNIRNITRFDPSKHDPSGTSYGPQDRRGLFSHLDYEEPEPFTVRAVKAWACETILRASLIKWPNNTEIRKISVATELAREEERLKPKPTLPPEYSDFSDVFDKPLEGILPPPRPYDHAINLDEDFVPKVAKAYPLSPKEKEAAEKFVDENLKEGKIRPSKSPQAAPFFFVAKKDGSLRPCQDYRYLNKHTVKDAYPLPLVSTLVDQLKGASIFTKMDVRSGYNNVRIKEGDQWKAAFITHKGLFEPTVMFFGLCNSPATFQRFMNDSFRDMIAEGWLVVYMDDLLIFSDDEETHRLRTLRVLQRMRELALPLKIEKCHFNLPEVEYLGMIVRKNTVAMDPVKVKGIADWPTPSKVKDVRSFLGFANFYRRFIPGYSNIARPLIDLTKKNTPWEWSSKCETAFTVLKKIFCMQPVLKMPDPSAPFSIATDASKHATGGVLMQQDTNGDWKPCAFLSQSLNPAERNYDIYDRELLAVIRALKEWRHYLHGSPYPVKVQTDHKNLTYFKQPQNLNRRQACWLLDLSDFDLELHHVLGKDLGAPDTLSR